MPLPNFLIIGAQKAGTTWLLHRLRQHPDVFLPPQEIHFFDKAENFGKGIAWYRPFFADAQAQHAIGEKTPDYCWTGTAGAEGHLPHAHRNIYEVLPDAKLLLVLRNPVDRAISAVNHLVRSGRVSPRHSVDRLLLGDKQHLAAPHGVIDYGRYMKHIAAYLEYFSREQLLILVFEEDIVAHPKRGLQKVTTFLGVDPSVPFTGLQERSHAPPVSKLGLYGRYYAPPARPFFKALDYLIGARSSKLQPSAGALNELYALYRPENERLFDFLGREIAAWRLPT